MADPLSGSITTLSVVDVAQSVERRSVAAEAAGSKPVIHPSKKSP